MGQSLAPNHKRVYNSHITEVKQTSVKTTAIFAAHGRHMQL